MTKVDKARFAAAFALSSEAIEGSVQGNQNVEDLWALLEPRLEEKTIYEKEVRDLYVESANDVRSWRRARLWASWFAVFIIMMMMTALFAVVFDPSIHPLILVDVHGDNVKIAFFAGSFGTILSLTALFLRGAYTPQRKEDSGLAVPEQLKAVLDAVGGVIGHKG